MDYMDVNVGLTFKFVKKECTAKMTFIDGEITIKQDITKESVSCKSLEDWLIYRMEKNLKDKKA